MIAPLITNKQMNVEDSFREFLTPKVLLTRILGVKKYKSSQKGSFIYPDWIAGMFMLFKSSDYLKLGGFDQSYFMYCEDMDICARMRNLGLNYAVQKNICVVHEARRDSSKKLRYFNWHIKSLLRFWFNFYFKRF